MNKTLLGLVAAILFALILVADAKQDQNIITQPIEQPIFEPLPIKPIDPVPPIENKPSSPSEIQLLLSAHNKEREARGKPKLELNSMLIEAAQKHSNWMAEKNRMDHVGKNRSSPSNRVKDEGYHYRNVGENIAMGYRDVNAVMRGWMNSAGHRNNILSNYEETGFGVAKSSKGTLYWTSVFASPRN